MGPVFPDAVHGGSQRTLRAIALGLGTAGHSVDIYCTARPDNFRVFSLGPGVNVSPTLRFKCRYPEPYYTAPYNLASIICDLLEAASKADVFYVHDAELAYSFVHEKLPTVVSFRDLVYPDTLSNGLSFSGDTLVVASDYMRRCVTDVLGRFRIGIADRIVTIPNGVDLSQFRPECRPQAPANIPPDATVILCPHRPDRRKGFTLALRLLQRLKKYQLATTRVPLLLIPRWVDSALGDGDGHEYQSIYDKLLQEATELGVRENLVIHDWVDSSHIAAYYSRASLVLCLGTFVEAFGNVPLECAACGVPSVVSALGGHIGKLPIPMSYEVAPNDLDAAFEAALLALTTPFPLAEARDFLATQYSFAKMQNAYVCTITEQRRLTPLPFRHRDPCDAGAVFRAPAWCRLALGGVYNDFSYQSSCDPEIIDLYRSGILPASAETLGRHHLDADKVRDLVARGYLTYSQ